MSSFQTYSANTFAFNRDADSSAIIENPFNANLNCILRNLTILDELYVNNLSITGTIVVHGTATFNGPVNINSNLNQIGNYILIGNINQVGNNFIIGTIQHTGSYNIIGTIQHTGSHNIIGTIQHTGSHNIIGTIQHTGSHNIIGTIQHTGSHNIIGTIQHTGSHNIIGNINQTGTHNIIGNINEIGDINQTGSYNIIGDINQTGSYNIIGQIKMIYSGTNDSIVISNTNTNQTGNDNIVIGNFTYSTNNYNLSNVIAIGSNTRKNSIGDLNSIFIGTNVLELNTSLLQDTTILGNSILRINVNGNLDESTIIGNNNLESYIGTNILKNTIIGSNNLSIISTSNVLSENVIVGTNNLMNTTVIGDEMRDNILLGNEIFKNMNFLTPLVNNFERNCLIGNRIGSDNNINGYKNFYSNTIIGDESITSNSNLTGLSGNTFVGQNVVSNNSNLNTISNSICVGKDSYSSLVDTTEILNCTLIGCQSNITGSSLICRNRTAIGYNSSVGRDYSLILGEVGTISTRGTHVGIGITNPTSGLLHIRASDNLSDSNNMLYVETKDNIGIFTVSNDGITVSSNASTITINNSSLNNYNCNYPNIVGSTTTPEFIVSARYEYQASYPLTFNDADRNIFEACCTPIGIIPMEYDVFQSGFTGVITITGNTYVKSTSTIHMSIQYLGSMQSNEFSKTITTFTIIDISNGIFSFKAYSDAKSLLELATGPVKVFYFIV